jgi:hypothetical protein
MGRTCSMHGRDEKCIQCFGLLSFWTLSIIHYFLETMFWKLDVSVFRRAAGDTYSVGSV